MPLWTKRTPRLEQLLQTVLYLSPDGAQTVLNSSPVASSDRTEFSHPLRFMHTIGAIYRHTLLCTQRARDFSHCKAAWNTALSCVQSTEMLLLQTKQAPLIASKEISREVNGRELVSTRPGMKCLPFQMLNKIYNFLDQCCCHIHRYWNQQET